MSSSSERRRSRRRPRSASRSDADGSRGGGRSDARFGCGASARVVSRSSGTGGAGGTDGPKRASRGSGGGRDGVGATGGRDATGTTDGRAGVGAVGGRDAVGSGGGSAEGDRPMGGGRDETFFATGASARVASRSTGAAAGATGGGGRDRASRIAAARSTSALERESSRVKRSVSPGIPSNTPSLYATTRPSPRTSGDPLASATSKRRITPCGRCCAPRRTMLVRVSVSSSRARKSSTVSYGRVIRTATGAFPSSATRRG